MARIPTITFQGGPPDSAGTVPIKDPGTTGVERKSGQWFDPLDPNDFTQVQKEIKRTADWFLYRAVPPMLEQQREDREVSEYLEGVTTWQGQYNPQKRLIENNDPGIYSESNTRISSNKLPEGVNSYLRVMQGEAKKILSGISNKTLAAKLQSQIDKNILEGSMKLMEGYSKYNNRRVQSNVLMQSNKIVNDAVKNSPYRKHHIGEETFDEFGKYIRSEDDQPVSSTIYLPNEREEAKQFQDLILSLINTGMDPDKAEKQIRGKQKESFENKIRNLLVNSNDVALAEEYAKKSELVPWMDLKDRLDTVWGIQGDTRTKFNFNQDQIEKKDAADLKALQNKNLSKLNERILDGESIDIDELNSIYDLGNGLSNDRYNAFVTIIKGGEDAHAKEHSMDSFYNWNILFTDTQRVRDILSDPEELTDYKLAVVGDPGLTREEKKQFINKFDSILLYQQDENYKQAVRLMKAGTLLDQAFLQKAPDYKQQVSSMFYQFENRVARWFANPEKEQSPMEIANDILTKDGLALNDPTSKSSEMFRNTHSMLLPDEILDLREYKGKVYVDVDKTESKFRQLIKEDSRDGVINYPKSVQKDIFLQLKMLRNLTPAFK